MKKFFEQPVAEIVKFNIEDVITTSVVPGEDEGDLDVGG